MALQQFVCGLTVMIILFCRGGHAEQPACARPVISSRIFGGENAVPGRWPWYAAIRYDDGRDICGGSLINNQWVLTSAIWTVRGYISGVVVYLGVDNRSDINPHEVSRRVETIVCHPEFNTQTLYNDICLLKLSAPVSFTNYIRPVCLASAGSTFHDGITSWMTGFGWTGSFDFDTPDILQEARVPIVGNNRCSCSFHSSFSVTENLICAGFEDGRNRTAFEDTGIPLVTKKGSVWVQIGIRHFLSWDIFSSGFSVFTRVSQFEKWINDEVSGMEPGFVTFTSPGIDSDLNYTCP